MKKIVVLSGGMDSVTVLYYATQNKEDEITALSFNYGSKHNEKEIPLAKHHCDKLGVKHVVIDLNLSQYFNSSLLQGGEEIPEGHYESENMKSTVVPFRNGIMLSFAVGYAENIGAKEVLLGSHAGDHAIYPDCRETFTQAIGLAAQLGTYNNVKIISPFNDLMKWDIVKIGNKLNVDYSMTHSCYKGNNKACGKCGTCVERLEAFEKAGLKDPIKYNN